MAMFVPFCSNVHVRRYRLSWGLVVSTLFLLGLSVSTTFAQVPKDPFSKAGFDSTPLTPQRSELPALKITLAQSFPLSGPLTETSQLALKNQGVWVLGTANELQRQWVPFRAGTPAPELEADTTEPPVDSNPWVSDAQPNLRYGIDSRGRLVAQKCCGLFRKGWRNKWKQRLPGKVKSQPLVFPKFLLVTASDNKIYSVNRRNGHVLWSVDAGERVSRPLARWTGPLLRSKDEKKPQHDLVVMIPDQGDRLMLLDASTGTSLVEYPLLDGGHKLVGKAAISDQGEILVLLQKYDLSDAALLVFIVETVQALDSNASSG